MPYYRANIYFPFPRDALAARFFRSRSQSTPFRINIDNARSNRANTLHRQCNKRDASAEHLVEFMNRSEQTRCALVCGCTTSDSERVDAETTNERMLIKIELFIWLDGSA